MTNRHIPKEFTNEELLKMNKIAYLLNLSSKQVSKFITTQKEKRHLLLWHFVKDLQRLKYKAFKELVVNIDTEKLDNWIFIPKNATKFDHRIKD